MAWFSKAVIQFLFYRQDYYTINPTRQ